MRKRSYERDSPALWCHILFEFFICKQATEDGQEMVVGEGWGGGELFLLLVGEALSSYPTHISTFIQFFLFSCRRNINICQHFKDPSGYRQKYINLFPFSITYSCFILNFRQQTRVACPQTATGYDWFPRNDHTWHQCRLDFTYFLQAFCHVATNQCLDYFLNKLSHGLVRRWTGLVWANQRDSVHRQRTQTTRPRWLNQKIFDIFAY